jgi:hypothetical protein
MVYVIIASVLAVAVSIVYLGYAWASFRQVSRERRQGDSDRGQQSSEWETESWFSWKAMISIVMSSVILFVVGQSAFAWNLVPFIAIGSAVAIIFAFAFDLRGRVG